MKKMLSSAACCMAIAAGFPTESRAQLSLTGQVRTRTEYRDGAGTLKPKTNAAAFFTSQRTRLTANYRTGRLILQTAIQDVRVWGADASTITTLDGARLGLHEGWAEVVLANRKDTTFSKASVDYFSVKAGRQEISYDDQRLLGNLDWLQGARRHDAVVLRLLEKGWQLDAGFAFNQNTDAFNYNGTYYTPANAMPYVKDSRGELYAVPAGFIPLTAGGSLSGNSSKTGTPALQGAPGTNGLSQNYRSFQYGYVARKLGNAKISALFFADQFGKSSLDSINTGGDGRIYGRRFNQKGTHARFTTGALVSSPLDAQKRLQFNGGYYYQFGKDRDALNLDAFTTTASLTLTRKNWAYTAGWDYLSGNDAFSSSPVNHRFDPLYGTPHKFWGYLDFFYAGTGAPAGGLSNAFAKARYTSKNKRFTVGADYHYFALANRQKDVQGRALHRYLGSELDIISGYTLNPFAGLEWGLSCMTSTNSMEYAKGAPPSSSDRTPFWSYLTLNVKPEFLFK